MNNLEIKLNLKTDEVLQKVLAATQGKQRDFVENITEVAKENSPYITGHNRSTITWDEEEGKFRVYTQSGYGAYLELGTSKQQAQPYIFPAYESSKQQFLDELQGSVK